MTNDLPKIDRWNSEPLDVHTWSDHPEIKALCDQLYDKAGLSVLEPKGIARPNGQSKKAYQAFRNSDRKDKLGQSLTDIQLATLLDAFIDKHPQFKGVLNTGQALKLMNIDSQIANMVIDHFTNKNIPVLCIHDSFII